MAHLVSESPFTCIFYSVQGSERSDPRCGVFPFVPQCSVSSFSCHAPGEATSFPTSLPVYLCHRDIGTPQMSLFPWGYSTSD